MSFSLEVGKELSLGSAEWGGLGQDLGGNGSRVQWPSFSPALVSLFLKRAVFLSHR